jgi:hypothetical protein
MKVKFFVFAMTPEQPERVEKEINEFMKDKKILNTHLIEVSQLGIMAVVYEETDTTETYSYITSVSSTVPVETTSGSTVNIQ